MSVVACNFELSVDICIPTGLLQEHAVTVSFTVCTSCGTSQTLEPMSHAVILIRQMSQAKMWVHIHDADVPQSSSAHYIIYSSAGAKLNVLVNASYPGMQNMLLCFREQVYVQGALTTAQTSLEQSKSVHQVFHQSGILPSTHSLHDCQSQQSYFFSWMASRKMSVALGFTTPHERSQVRWWRPFSFFVQPVDLLY